MTYLPEILGPARAEQVVRDHAATLMRMDHLTPQAAIRLVRARVAEGDLLFLADAGQTWTLHPDADPDDAPAAVLSVHARLSCPARVLVSDPEDPTEVTELGIDVLNLYRLTTWHPATVPTT
jgi:hypothetical protein